MDRPAEFLWDFLVVDNGSTDETLDTVRQFQTRLPIRVVSEQTPGLSNARNRGVQAALGAYLVWTDDDVIVQRDWLCAYADAFRRWPDAAVFGGKIIPVLEEPICAWFAECVGDLRDPLAARDFGNEVLSLSIDQGRLPFGANYAIRTTEQRANLYDPELGVAPGRSRMGEESTVIRTILKTGHGYYLPDSTVHHMIGADRQTISYIRSYYRAHGETAALVEDLQDTGTIGGFPLWLWRRLLTEAIAYEVHRRLGSAREWLPYLKRYAYAQGYAKGYPLRKQRS